MLFRSGLPRGADGNGTGSNLTLSNATPANLGTPAAGASNAAARADHVHQLPQLVSSLNGLAGGVNLVAGANITITAGSGNLTIAAAGGGLAANAAIDGGFYVGEIVGGITFLTQPQSQTLNSSTTLTLGNVAAGTELLALSGNIGDVTGFNGTLYAQRIDGNKAGLIYSTDNGATWEWTNITRTNSAAQYGFGQYVTSGFANGATVVRYLSVGPEMLMASNGTRAVVVTAITDNVGGFSDSAQSLSRVYVADAVANLANAVTINAYGLRSVCYLPTAGRWAWTDWSGFIATS